MVLPGVPLISLIDLGDMWVQFDLREDLLHDLKAGSKIAVRVPALGDRIVELEVRVIGAKGEYTGWRATRSSGDFEPSDVRDPSLSDAAGSRIAARDECLHGLDRTALVIPLRPGLFAVAAREVRWILGDPVASFLLFGVPIIAFALLGFTFSSAVVRGLDVVAVDMDNTPTSRLFIRTIAAAPGITITERANDLGAAASAIRAGRAIAAIYLPPDFGKDVLTGRAPRAVSFSNSQFFTPGSDAARAFAMA